MSKFLFTTLTVVLMSAFVVAKANAQTQNWECAVDLQQGDRGTMSLLRNGDRVDGSIRMTRNSNAFNSDISGRWGDNTIDLNRLIGSNSSEPMTGIVIDLGTEKIRIGGRYSSDYQGVWSADCDLVSAPQLTKTSAESSPIVEDNIEPSITSRAVPNSPTEGDRIKLSAKASHPDGVKSVAFFIGNKKVHSCNSDSCEYQHTKLSKGNYTWRVEAISQSGIKNTNRDNKLVVRAQNVPSTCTISGTATGPSAALSISYLVNIYGQNNAGNYNASSQFQGAQYEFRDVPVGDYLIKVDTLSDTSVLWSPETASVNCAVQANIRQDFDFR